MSTRYKNAEYFFYMASEESKKREFVIYELDESNKSRCSWPKKSMIFFKSTGSSNESSNWLTNTYFPTTGLTCHSTEPYIFSDYNNHTTLEGIRHVHGHITKLSDYNFFLKKNEPPKKNVSSPYYEFKELSSFYKFLTDKLIYFLTNNDFINSNKELIIERKEKYKDYKYYSNLIKCIQDYFSCEEQLKISYSLNNNEGLWGWEFCNITFADICKERWGEELPNEINKIKTSDISKEYLNTDETNDYLVSKDVNINFTNFLDFINSNNLFTRYEFLSQFLNKYNDTLITNSSLLLINKALTAKKLEEKKLITTNIVTLSQQEPISIQEKNKILQSKIFPPPRLEIIKEDISLKKPSSFMKVSNKSSSKSREITSKQFYKKPNRTSVKKRESNIENKRENKSKQIKKTRETVVSTRRKNSRIKKYRGGNIFTRKRINKYKKYKSKRIRKTRKYKYKK